MNIVLNEAHVHVISKPSEVNEKFANSLIPVLLIKRWLLILVKLIYYCIFLSTIDKEILIIQMIILEVKKSCGWDGMSSKLLKKYKFLLLNPLLHLINEPLSSVFYRFIKD